MVASSNSIRRIPRGVVVLVLTVLVVAYKVFLQPHHYFLFSGSGSSNMTSSSSILSKNPGPPLSDEFHDLGVITLPSKNSNRKSIRLLQLTDFHLFPKDCPSFEHINISNTYDLTLKLVDQLIRDTDPDVLVLTGDIMDGRGPWGSAERVLDVMHDLLPLFRNLPWLYIPGNHDDDESPWTRHDLLRILQLPGCLQANASSFHSTLLLKKEEDTLQVRIHLFDSGGNHPSKTVYYYPTPKATIRQFEQYCSQQAQISLGAVEDIPALAYIHIPTPEFQNIDPVIGHNNLFQAVVTAGKLPFPLNKLVWLIKLLHKDRIAGCTRGGHDTGLLPAIWRMNEKANANILGVFCGHDHHSDALFYKKDLFFGYGRAACFTPPFNWEGKAPNSLEPGARVVEVSPTRDVTTWIQTTYGSEGDSFLDMTNYKPEKSCLWPC